uniref:PPPDE domain-containing protein n=1 Tax=Noctiluca scintillans TaxID=2966 RepID=A0A7S1B070_NOCSC
MEAVRIVRVRNATNRTFRIRAAEFLGAFASECLTIPPHFDEAIPGLSVPWAPFTRNGLCIWDGEDTVRCVVGPHGGSSGDWLRLHADSWDSVAKRRWIPLKCGSWFSSGAVELELVFTERGSSKLQNVVCFEAPRSAPSDTVFLNIYDLLPSTSLANSVLDNGFTKRLGAYHAAVEVYGREWSFFKTREHDDSGIFESPTPRYHSVHVFRESINLGRTSLDIPQIDRLFSRMGCLWTGGRYDLLSNNCIHFCDAALGELGVGSVPTWARCLHEVGASLLGMVTTLGCVFPQREPEFYESTAKCPDQEAVPASRLSSRSTTYPDDDEWTVFEIK